MANHTRKLRDHLLDERARQLKHNFGTGTAVIGSIMLIFCLCLCIIPEAAFIRVHFKQRFSAWKTALVNKFTRTPRTALERGGERDPLIIMKPTDNIYFGLLEDVYYGLLNDPKVQPATIKGTWYCELLDGPTLQLATIEDAIDALQPATIEDAIDDSGEEDPVVLHFRKQYLRRIYPLDWLIHQLKYGLKQK